MTVNAYTCKEVENKTWHFTTNEDKCESYAENKQGNMALSLLWTEDLNSLKEMRLGLKEEWVICEFCNWCNLSKV